MKNLVIFYTVSGQTEIAAKCIARLTGAEMCQIETEEKIQKDFFQRYKAAFRQMHKMKTHEYPAVKPVDVDFDSYDIIYLGSPNWNANLPPAMEGFLKESNFSGKDIRLFITYAGRGAEKCLDNLEAMVDGNTVNGKHAFRNPKKMSPEKLREEVVTFCHKTKEDMHEYREHYRDK